VQNLDDLSGFSAVSFAEKTQELLSQLVADSGFRRTPGEALEAGFVHRLQLFRLPAKQPSNLNRVVTVLWVSPPAV
jgi:hypothetical protein